MAYKIVASVLAVLVAGAIPVFGQVNQRAVLYDQNNGNGNYVVIPGVYAPALSSMGFDNRARSVCVTGIWLFYQDQNYNNQGARGMEYVFGRNNYCVNIRTIAGTISSGRFAGPPRDYTGDSFTLYQNDYFQGQEEYTLTDLPYLSLAGDHKSIIITGNSHWTVFDQQGYKGQSICLMVPEPGTFTPAFLSDVSNIRPNPIPHGTIRSVRKGCLDTSNNVTLQSFGSGIGGKNSFVPTQLV